MEVTEELKERYSDFIVGLELDTVYLKSVNTSFDDSVPFDEHQQLKVRFDQQATHERLDDDSYKIIQRWNFRVSSGGGRKIVLKMRIDLAIVIFSRCAITDDIFELFTNNNLVLSTWPYVREIVNNLTLRMNLPPLTLPFFKTVLKPARGT